MTVEEYFEEWKKFDFWYQMSDSHSVYLRGQQQLGKMEALAKGNKTLEEICHKMRRYNDSLGNEPKPKLEDYT